MGGATPGGDVAMVTPSLLQQQDLRRLTRAIQHLRKYTDVLLHSLQPDPKLELYWDSWTREGDQQGSTPSSGSDPTSWSRKPSSSTSPPLPPPPPAFKYGGGGGLISGGGRKAPPPSSQRIPSTPVGAFKQEELVNPASIVTAGLATRAIFYTFFIYGIPMIIWSYTRLFVWAIFWSL